VLADVTHVDLPGPAGVIVIVDPGGEQALPGYLEMRIHENGAVRMYVPGNREYSQLPEFGRAFDGLGFLSGMRARRISGPPGRSVAQVSVDTFAEFTTAPRGRIPVEDPQHVPGFGRPGAERVEVVQFQRVLRVSGEYDAGKHVLIEPFE
jgi:hypothetical protein